MSELRQFPEQTRQMKIRSGIMVRTREIRKSQDLLLRYAYNNVIIGGKQENVNNPK
ncbi:MAG: hypothetical protein WBA22_01660 [Candidatus Methanofastidiosia archaeon]